MAAEDRDVLFQIGFTEHPNAQQSLDSLSSKISGLQQQLAGTGGALHDSVAGGANDASRTLEQATGSAENLSQAVAGAGELFASARDQAIGMAAGFIKSQDLMGNLDLSKLQQMHDEMEHVAMNTRDAVEASVLLTEIYQKYANEAMAVAAHMERVNETVGEVDGSLSALGEHTTTIESVSSSSDKLGDSVKDASSNIDELNESTKENANSLDGLANRTEEWSKTSSQATSRVTQEFIALTQALEGTKGGEEAIAVLSAAAGALGADMGQVSSQMPSPPSGDSDPNAQDGDFDVGEALKDDLLARAEIHYQRIDSLRKKDGESAEAHTERVANTYLVQTKDAKVWAKNITGIADTIRNVIDGVSKMDLASEPDNESYQLMYAAMLEQAEAFVTENESLDKRLAAAEREAAEEKKRALEQAAKDEEKARKQAVRARSAAQKEMERLEKQDEAERKEAIKARDAARREIEKIAKEEAKVLAQAEKKRVAEAAEAARQLEQIKRDENAAISKAAKEQVYAYEEVSRQVDEANRNVEQGTRQVLTSFNTLGQGVGKVARGLTVLNILDEEDSAEILKTVGYVQGLIDTVGGLTHTVSSAIKGWDGLTKMLTGTKTAKEKEREETELAMKSSKLLEEALKRELLTARQAAKAHEALAKARAGESSKKAARDAERNAAGFGGLGRPGSMASAKGGDDKGGGAGDKIGTVGDLIGGEAGDAISGLGEHVSSITEGLDGLNEISPRLETTMTKLGKTISNGLTKAMTKFKGGLGKIATKGSGIFSKLMSSKLGKVVGKAGKSLGKYALSAGAAFKTFAGGTAAAAAGLASAFVAAAAGVAFAATSIWYAFDDSANAVGGYNDVIATAEVSTLNWIGTTTGAFDLVGDAAYEVAEAAAWQSWNMGVASAAAESLAISLDKVTQNAESEIRRKAQKADADVFDQNKGMLKTTEEKLSAVDSRISQLTQEKEKRVSERGEVEKLEGRASEAKRRAAVFDLKEREDGELSEEDAAARAGWLKVEADAESQLAEIKSNYHQEESALDEELLRRQKEKLQLTKQQESELISQTKKEVSALEQVIRFRQKEIDKITERGEADKKSYAESRKAAIESAEDRFASMSKSEQRRAVQLVKDLKSGKMKAEELRDRDADLLGNVGGDFANDQLRKRNNANARANGFDEELFGTTENQDKDFAEREKERVENLAKAEEARQRAIDDMAKKTGKTTEQVEDDIRAAENRQKETGARVDIIDQREIEVKIESQFEEKIESINELIVSAIRATQESEAQRIREVAEETVRRLQTEEKNKQKQAKQTSK